MFHMPHNFNTLKQLWLIAAAAAQNNHCVSVVLSRSPNPVAILFANGLRQPISRSVEIYCRCLSPAVGKDGSPSAFFRRQAVVNLSDLLHHLLPAELVGKPLRQRTILLMLDFRRLQPKRIFITDKILRRE